MAKSGGGKGPKVNVTLEAMYAGQKGRKKKKTKASPLSVTKGVPKNMKNTAGVTYL